MFRSENHDFLNTAKDQMIAFHKQSLTGTSVDPIEEYQKIFSTDDREDAFIKGFWLRRWNDETYIYVAMQPQDFIPENEPNIKLSDHWN